MTELDAGEIAPPSFGAHLIVETTHDAMEPQYRMIEGEAGHRSDVGSSVAHDSCVCRCIPQSLFLPNRAMPAGHRSPSSRLRWLAHLCVVSVSTMVSRETIDLHEIMVPTGSFMERQIDNIPMAQRPTIFIARQTQTRSNHQPDRSSVGKKRRVSRETHGFCRLPVRTIFGPKANPL